MKVEDIDAPLPRDDPFRATPSAALPEYLSRYLE
jgi:hypothetical protein